MGFETFKKLFPVILTDNGTEFSNPEALETSPFTGQQRTRIYFCDPYSSWQKGHIENNHENLRKIFTKGETLDNFNQADINLAISHLNSFAKVSLNDIPAIKLFEQIYGEDILRKLDIKQITQTEVFLTPILLKK